MSNKVAVVQGEVVSALGPDFETLWVGLMAGCTGVVPVTRFPVKGCVSELAALIPLLDMNENHLKVDLLLESLLLSFPNLPKDCLVLLASTKAGVEEVERARFFERAPSLPVMYRPVMLDNYLKKQEVKNSILEINAACASSTIALARAAAMIRAGDAEAVFVCAYDVITEFVFCGFSSLRALSPNLSKPFDETRSGLNLGEAAVGVLLMSEARAQQENKKILGYISGWGLNNDAHHVTAPTRDGSGLYAAIEKAMKSASLSAEAIAGISAHGTGTVHNDLMELKAFHNFFGGKTLPTHSAKGAIGHTLGAAGAIEALLSLKMLEKQIMPPTIGFEQPIEELPSGVSALEQQLEGRHLLSSNSGFGGVNAALVLTAAS